MRPGTLCAGALLLLAAGCGISNGVRSFYWTLSGRLEDDAQALATYAHRFRDRYGRWPSSYQEWEQFTEQESGEEIWLRRLDRLVFHAQHEDELVVVGEYEGPGYADSTSHDGSRPNTEPVVIRIKADGGLQVILEPGDVEAYLGGDT